MVEKKQTKRYTDKEMSLIKNTFKDNDSLLKSIRKVMLQLPLNVVDLSNLKLLNKDLLAILRKTFLPTIDPEAPFTQIIDLWMTVSIADKLPREALIHLIARQRLIDYIEQQLNFLEKGEEGKIRFIDFIKIDGGDPDDVYANLTARNTMIQHTEQQLSVLQILAEQAEETTEEQEKRQQKDSSK